jgi:hypothetical protein
MFLCFVKYHFHCKLQHSVQVTNSNPSTVVKLYKDIHLSFDFQTANFGEVGHSTGCSHIHVRRIRNPSKMSLCGLDRKKRENYETRMMSVPSITHYLYQNENAQVTGSSMFAWVVIVTHRSSLVYVSERFQILYYFCSLKPFYNLQLEKSKPTSEKRYNSK